MRLARRVVPRAKRGAGRRGTGIPSRPFVSARSIVVRAAFLAVAVAAGVAAATLLARPGSGAAPLLHEVPFQLALGESLTGGARRSGGDAGLEVTVAKPLILPYAFGDCDLLATVVLPADGQLDVVCRKFEPPGGHGRFVVLRLSATADGPAWATREAALFGPADAGAKVAAGLPASVRIELRGRRARAAVAGRNVGEIETVDDRGGFAFVVRGGTAEVRHLQILPVPRARGVRLPLAAAAIGVVVALALGARMRPRAVFALAAMPAGAAGLHALLAPHLIPAAPPVEAAILVAVGALAVVAIALGRRGGVGRTLARLGAAAVIGVCAAEGFVRVSAERLTACEDPRLDLLFGFASQSAPFDALARMLRGKNEVHTAEPDLQRVVFLGGEPMFEASLDRAHHLGIQATARAAGLLRRDLVAAVFPTAFPHTVQQIELFRRFYADVYPAVAIVLGVDRFDAFAEGPASARERLARADAGDGRACGLRALVADARREPVMLASPAELATTLADFARWCAERRVPLLLATHALCAPEYRDVVAECARTFDLQFVPDAMSEDDRADVERLAVALAEALR